jgi:hypothetical protein
LSASVLAETGVAGQEWGQSLPSAIPVRDLNGGMYGTQGDKMMQDKVMMNRDNGNGLPKLQVDRHGHVHIEGCSKVRDVVRLDWNCNGSLISRWMVQPACIF